MKLIANTGIQIVTLKKTLTFDFGNREIPTQYYCEWNIDLGDNNEMFFLEPVYFFANSNKYVRRSELCQGGYLNNITNEWYATEEEIDFRHFTPLDDSGIMTISNLNITINRVNLFNQLVNQWLPIPLYDLDAGCSNNTPTNWCRMKMIPIKEYKDEPIREYKVVLSFDTQSQLPDLDASCEAIDFQGAPSKNYSLCGISNDIINTLPQDEAKRLRDISIPLRAYEFCDLEKRSWVNSYLSKIFFGSGFSNTILTEGSRLKYLSFYIYFLSYLHKKNIIPTVTLYNDVATEVIKTTLVVDIGNSRTYGLIAESPVLPSFSNVVPLQITDLETGERYAEPFDMRFAFHKERFGEISQFGSSQFIWPSILRMGKEAHRLIYNEEESNLTGEKVYSYYSSPKRYLWDNDIFDGQWEYISTRSTIGSANAKIDMEGIVQQFHEDGSFAPDPTKMGVKSSYSRRSLMTFCFVEILLQAQMQANSSDDNPELPGNSGFLSKNGKYSQKRVIDKIIITCPTAMARSEQIALRSAALEACVVIERYHRKTYSIPYTIDINNPIINIIPSVRDLKRTMDTLEHRTSWNFDEATCCQMFYLLGQAKRYNGKINEFFKLYGKNRTNQRFKLIEEKSVIIGSLDIGAGTTDMRICVYRQGHDSETTITPIPILGESFNFAGDDLVHAIIKAFVIESHDETSPGVIARKLSSLGPLQAAEKMNLFFTDAAVMGVHHRKMRSKFNVQIAIPIANKLLTLLSSNSPSCELSFNEIFDVHKPSSDLLAYFESHFGFDFRELKIPFTKESMNNVIENAIKLHLKKWSAILSSYSCDIVLLGGRPSTLEVIQKLIRQNFPVAPNRIISMNTFRVGNWYPDSTGRGYMREFKSLVAVGALIAEMAQNGSLPELGLNTSELIASSVSTADYILSSENQTPCLSPIKHFHNLRVSSFPKYIYFKQFDLPNYPSKVLYKLDIDRDAIRSNLQLHNPSYDAVRLAIELENRIARIGNNPFVEFELQRDYHTNKEVITIENVYDSNGNSLSRADFILHAQSVDNEGTNWLDSGIFKVNINN